MRSTTGASVCRKVLAHCLLLHVSRGSCTRETIVRSLVVCLLLFGTLCLVQGSSCLCIQSPWRLVADCLAVPCSMTDGLRCFWSLVVVVGLVWASAGLGLWHLSLFLLCVLRLPLGERIAKCHFYRMSFLWCSVSVTRNVSVFEIRDLRIFFRNPLSDCRAVLDVF